MACRLFSESALHLVGWWAIFTDMCSLKQVICDNHLEFYGIFEASYTCQAIFSGSNGDRDMQHTPLEAHRPSESIGAGFVYIEYSPHVRNRSATSGFSGGISATFYEAQSLKVG